MSITLIVLVAFLALFFEVTPYKKCIRGFKGRSIGFEFSSSNDISNEIQQQNLYEKLKADRDDSTIGQDGMLLNPKYGIGLDIPLDMDDADYANHSIESQGQEELEQLGQGQYGSKLGCKSCRS